MSEYAIRVSDLTKFFRHYPAPSGRLLEWLSGGRLVRHVPLYALRDVTFNVKKGEAVAIVGVNGAGKSTLLSVLMGTIHRSGGHVEVNGTIAGLLELGLGLHPGFSGEENARLALKMRGANEGEVEELLADVIEFSELGDAIKRPVRTYSTGMQMRLGFAIATARRPDILVIDEALAVGDAPFQFKCIERIRHFKEMGATLLFVSHDLTSMKSLCEKAVLLDSGRLRKAGEVDQVLDAYNALISGQKQIDVTQDDTTAHDEMDTGSTQISEELKAIQTRSGSGEVRVKSWQLLNANKKPTGIFTSGERMIVRCRIEVTEAVKGGLTVGMLIRDRFSQDIFGSNTFGQNIEKRRFRAGEVLSVDFDVTLNLATAHYFVTFAVHAGKTHLEGNYDWIDNAATFEVLPDANLHFAGIVNLPHETSVKVT